VQIIKEARVTRVVLGGKGRRKRIYGRVHVLLPGYLVGQKVVVAVWAAPTPEELKHGEKGIPIEEKKEEGVVAKRVEAAKTVRVAAPVQRRQVRNLRDPVLGLPPAEILRMLEEIREATGKDAKREVAKRAFEVGEVGEEDSLF
jgi:hypothetical protein